MAWSHDIAPLLSIAVITIAIFTWSFRPFPAPFIASGIALIATLWSWGIRQDAQGGWLVAALILLATIAAIQRRHSEERSRRAAQALEELTEARQTTEQAVQTAETAAATLQEKLSHYAALQSVAEALSSTTNRETIAEIIVSRAMALIGRSEVCLLFLVDDERQSLSLICSRKREPTLTIAAKQGDVFDRHVLRTRRPLLVADVRRDFRFNTETVSDRPIHAVIACPLWLGAGVQGVLRLDSAQPNAYTQDDLRLLDIVADLGSTAVANANLFAAIQRLAMTDGLTGLLLRRPFLEQLAHELLQASRTHERLSILMVDLDHFKSANDTSGHRVGDVILGAVAGLLRRTAPPESIVGRYGGDEFSVVIPRCARTRAAEIAEQIRVAVSQQIDRRRPSTGERPAASRPGKTGTATRLTSTTNIVAREPVTVSIGVATFPEDAQTDLELIQAADKRLYQAKQLGRNRVCSS